MLLTLSLLTTALAAPGPLSNVCAEPTGGRAYLFDGATMDWAGRALTCDGDQMCEYTLPDGHPATFATTGQAIVTYDCGGLAQVQLMCEHGRCSPERVATNDEGGLDQPYFHDWAPAADGTRRAFLPTLHGEPAALLTEPEPIQAEVRQLAIRLADTLADCEKLACVGERGPVDWRGAGQAAATLVMGPVAVSSVDRDLWGARGWTARFTADAGLSGELDCFEFSGECDLHAQACSLTIRSGNRTVATYSEPYQDGYEPTDASWMHEARVDGLVIGTGGGPGLAVHERRTLPDVVSSK